MSSSIKRPLPATPFADINTTPRSAPVSNSFMNAKLDQLEYKLYSNVKMKQHRHPKITTLLTKSKNNCFLKIENKLLKDDNSNKQKLVDDILGYNINLMKIQNFDTAREARKKVPKNHQQSYKRNSINLAEKKKHVRNIFCEERNFKNGSDKQNSKISKSHKDGLPSDKSSQNDCI